FEFSDAKTPINDMYNPLDWRYQNETYGEANYYEARLINLNEDEVMALVRNITPLKRVQDELRNHIEDLNLVRQVNNELSASLKLNLVAELALDATMRLSGAQAGYLAMADDDDTLSLLGMVGAYKHAILNRALLDKKGVLSRIWRTQAPELIQDVSQDPDYEPLLDDTEAMIIIPLLSNERIIGILTLESRREDRFSNEQFQFLQLITGRIAAFLENASLHETTQAQVVELQQLYDEVSKLEQIKTDMIRIASHDLKNPLSSVIGYLDFLRSLVTDKLSEQEVRYFDKIEEASHNMESLIGGILNLEFIEHLSEQQALERVDFTQLVRASVGENMDNAVRKKQTLTIYVPDEPIFLEIDPFQLREAITNLVSNAVKYTPDEGTINVRLWEADELVSLRVKIDALAGLLGYHSHYLLP
ncbi:MAG: GAF domain-containing protein, partial [Chloroflexota bacterium]